MPPEIATVKGILKQRLVRSAEGDAIIDEWAEGISLPNVIRDKWECIRIGASSDANLNYYDVRCTGTDDEDAINGALAELTAGGRLRLGPGNFYCSTPVIHRENSVDVGGVNIGSRANAAVQTEAGTNLKAVTGFVGDALYIADDDGGSRSVARVGVHDLVLDVNEITEAVSGDGISGMKLAIRESNLRNLYIASCTGYGIDLYGNSAGDVYNDQMAHIWIRECIGTAGIHFAQYAADWNLFGVIVGSVDDGAGTGWGLLFDGGGGAGGRFVGCNLYDNVYNARFNGTNRLEFIGCSFNDAKRHCMFFDGDQANSNTWINFTGCEWKQNGKATTNTYDVFHFAGDSANKNGKINVVGGAIEKGSVSEEPRYAFGKSGSASAALQGLQVQGVWVDVVGNFGTGFHNLTNDNLVRFWGNANLQDWDSSNLQTAARAKTAVISGGAAGNHTVTGITVYDRLIGVIHNTAGALVDITSEFSITATNTINNTGGTDTTGDQLLVLYQDNTP